jgi:hypothetical protein
MNNDGTAFVYVPHAVSDEIRAELRRKMCERYGGFTSVDGAGGWKAPNGDIIAEPVAVHEVAGATPAAAADMAAFVAERSDEDCVMWRHSNGTHGMID